MMEGLLKAYVQALLESEELEEFSAVGAVQGMSLPVGKSAGKAPEPIVLPFRKNKKRKK